VSKIPELPDTILPAGFGLDEFGIIVHEQFAVPRLPSNTRPPPEPDLTTEPSDGTSDSELSDLPKTDMEPSEPPTSSQHSEAGAIDDATINWHIDELLKEIEPEPESAPNNPESNSPNPPMQMSLRKHTPPSYKETPSYGSRSRSAPVKASAAASMLSVVNSPCQPP
jgi:hypothetical protein